MTSVSGRDPFTNRAIQVHVKGERIAEVTELNSETDCWIAPGLIDLQVNGYGGIDLNGDHLDSDSMLDLVRVLARLGTTTFLPTIITAEQKTMISRLRALATAFHSHEEIRNACPGIHVEGPWISPRDGYRGAHPSADVRAPSLGAFDELQTASDGRIRLVTFSPHWEESSSFVRALVERGVTVSIGHTHASPADIQKAVDAGARLSTHLGNGLPMDLPRHPNPIWTQLADDRLSAMMIADGIHLTEDIMRVMLRSKGVGRMILVSDSVALAGSATGEYVSHIGGSVTLDPDGSIRMSGSGLLAGSGIALKDAVIRAASVCTLSDSLRMSTSNPAAALGLQAGSLSPGSLANLIRFRWAPGATDMEIVDVMVHGALLA